MARETDKAYQKREKRIEKEIRKINDMQRYKDENDLVKRDAEKHPTRDKVETVAAAGVFSGIIAAQIGVAALSGNPAVMALPIASAGMFGGSAIVNARYNKSLSDRIDKAIKKLDDSGIKVSSKDVDFSYIYNEKDYGNIDTKRYYTE